MRKRLTIPSSNIRFLLLGLSILATIAAIFFSIKAWRETANIFASLVVFVFMLVVAALFYLVFRWIKTAGYIEFDQDTLYLVGQDTEEKIDMKSIYELEKPLIQGRNSVNNWIVKYKQEGKEMRVKMSVSFYKENFAQFKSRVKKANPKLIVKSW